MLGYIGRKLLTAAATVLILATLTFFLVKLLPGNPFLSETVPEVIQQKQRNTTVSTNLFTCNTSVTWEIFCAATWALRSRKWGDGRGDHRGSFPVSAKLGLISFLISEASAPFRDYFAPSRTNGPTTS